MVYPPTLPPATRTDSTIAAGNHASDHNALVAAITALLSELGASPSGVYADLTTRLEDLAVLSSLEQRLPIHIEAEFGAAGDGVTNDTAAWVAALAEAKATGRPIYAPRKYLVDGDTLVIDQPVTIEGAGSPGSGGYGSIYRASSGNMFRIESNFTMRNMFIYDAGGVATRTGAALAFRAVYDATTGALQRTAGFCRFDNVRVSTTTVDGNTSAWERIIDADGSNGWLNGDNAHFPAATAPPIRDVVFVGCMFFGGRTANDTIKLNRVAHFQFIGGFHDPAPVSTVPNGITISADSTDVQFAGFEAIANVNTAGAKVAWVGGNLGANNGAALTIASTSTYTLIAAPVNGTIVDNSPPEGTTAIYTTRNTIPRVFGWDGVLGHNPLRWRHSNANYRNTLGAISGGGYGFVGLHSEHSSTASLLKNDDSGIRGFAIINASLAVGAVSFVFGDTTVAGATWAALNSSEPLRLRYAATAPGADIGRTPTGNHVAIDGTVTTGSPTVAAGGADTNISLNVNGKGAGIVSLNVTGGGGTSGFRSGDGASGVKFKVNGSGYIDTLNGLGIAIRAAAGSPEGVVSAIVGSIYLRADGGATTTLYVKESGTGTTGWVAK